MADFICCFVFWGNCAGAGRGRLHLFFWYRRAGDGGDAERRSMPALFCGGVVGWRSAGQPVVAQAVAAQAGGAANLPCGGVLAASDLWF